MIALRRTIMLVLLCLTCAVRVVATVNADSVMSHVYKSFGADDSGISECLGKLYVKQYVNLEKWNIGLNMIPGMTRFDRDENRYLTELFYDVHFLDYAMPSVIRRAHLTTHRHGKGEMERVISFMVPALFGEKLFDGGYLSPLQESNRKYYRYEVDTVSDSHLNQKLYKIQYRQCFDNIKLLSYGWFIVDDLYHVREFYAEGWDEQCNFDVHYVMGQSGRESFLVSEVTLSLDYDFAGNKLHADAYGIYDYDVVLPPVSKQRKNKYDLSSAITSDLNATPSVNIKEYTAQHRRLPLSPNDFAFYIKKKVLGGAFSEKINETEDKKSPADLLWTLGDQMISSHRVDWNGGNMKVSPILDPSHLSYSSTHGLSYKMKMNIRNELKRGKEFALKPVMGYNFKHKAFYWDVDGGYMYDPAKIGRISFNVGSGNRTYSSIITDKLEKMDDDSVDFKRLDFNYFKNLYADISVQREIANGLELLVGVNFHKRKLVGSLKSVDLHGGLTLDDTYTQFAPRVRLTWQPGMYYYMKNGKKVNVGSRMPRFSLDIEQGIRGVLGSTDIYTRSEVDVQYKLRVNQCDALYLRAGGGGFFYTKDVYFVDYAFFKHNYLPVDKSDELCGTFQLLDSEWYNSAKKYFRLHAAYESPFLVFQRLFPKVRFLKDECLYFNALIMSHLTPYSELGYSISTPYVDVGVFVSGKNHQFHSFGYKISISLFNN